MSNFVNKFYNSKFVPEFSVLVSKETIGLVYDEVYEAGKQNTKLAAGN